MSTCARLPVEVIERIIDSSADDPRTLSTFSLCCRTLLPRSRRHLFVRICIRTFEQMYSVSAFLQSRPWLTPLVGQVKISACSPGPSSAPAALLAVVPLPLLTRLPNLRHWTMAQEWFISKGDMLAGVLSFNRHALAGFEQYGTRIHKLTIRGLQFSTCADMGRFLLAFPNVQSLHCDSCSITRERYGAADHLVRQRLAAKLRLKPLTISASTGKRVVDLPAEISQATLEHLVLCMLTPQVALEEAPVLCFPRLRSLSIDIQIADNYRKQDSEGHVLPILKVVTILKSLTSSDTLICNSLPSLHYFLSLDVGTETCREFDTAILDSSARGTLILQLHSWASCAPQTSGNKFWTSRVEQHFPKLHSRNSLKVQYAPSNPLTSRTLSRQPVAHEDFVTVLTASADGKWFATGSKDSTIVLWDVKHPASTLDWIAHERRVSDLAFSPDSQYLLSVGSDITPKIWDLGGHPGRLVATLDGHHDYVRRCAWANTGTLFATGSYDGSVRVWHGPSIRDHAFQQCYVFTDPRAGPLLQALRFSPSARSLLAIHLPLPGEPDAVPSWRVWHLGADPNTPPKALDRPKTSTFVVAALDSTDRHLVAASRDGSEVNLHALETGEDLMIVTQPAAFSEEVTRVILSPNNRYLLREVGFGGAYDLLDLETHRITALSSDTMLYSPSFSHGGQYIATASNAGVCLWNTSDCSCAAVMKSEVRGLDDSASVLTFSGDAGSLAVGDRSGDVRIHRMEDFVWLRPL
ncbi:WD40 repeat-like protein [Dichomitus squalens]|uniref:WD40 repeat-like protein n=1 Tax=Dichomitus squalens TaxID=114155 RepID=A0A4V2K7H2_9APHY|nr:WD40 repeat-like protein [Dichomitus squalens]